MKIVLLFFTFSGIYTLNARDLAANSDSGVVVKKTSMRFFPNPAKHKISIEIKNFDVGNVQVQLLDNSGNILLNDKRLVLSGDEVIVFMFSQKPGLYLLLVRQHATVLKSQIVIQ